MVIAMTEDETPNAAARQTFVLSPHRSLGPRGFLILMLLYGGVSSFAGLYFFWLGAWPVLGFCGLDVALVYAAFRLNYRAARATEMIEIGPEELALIVRNGSGRELRRTFNPYWLRVELIEMPGGVSELRLTSKGRSLVVGRFLSDPERRDLAVALRMAIAH